MSEGLCLACRGSLSWAAPGVYERDICTVAHREGKTIEQVRREVEELARDCTAMFEGTRPHFHADFGNGDHAIIHMEPEGDAPHFDWPPINRKQVAWEAAHMAGVRG
jgi:hypothetical protein